MQLVGLSIEAHSQFTRGTDQPKGTRGTLLRVGVSVGFWGRTDSRSNKRLQKSVLAVASG